MTEESPKDEGAGREGEALIRGIADLAEAALGVGVALGRTVADATARGRVVPQPVADRGQIAEIIHYGVVIVRNMLGLVFSVAPVVTPKARGSAERGPAQPASPTVHQGGTLRIPLSVENPAAQAMTGLRFRCKDLKATGLGPGVPVDGDDFRFEPAELSIGPRDFEKLTLYIDARADAAPGHYVAAVGVSDESVELTVTFDVLPAED
jgi:hypothetical protein